jgi:hypothetical protein
MVENIEGIGKATKEDIMNLINEPGFINLVGMTFPPRPGVQIFSTRLEHECYKPDTDKNEEFRMAIVKWNDLHFSIVNIPEAGLMEALIIAEECGLRFAEGTPRMFGGNISEGATFPFFNEKTCRMLENVRGHEIYEKQNAMEIFKEETEQCKEIFKKHLEWINKKDEEERKNNGK